MDWSKPKAISPLLAGIVAVLAALAPAAAADAGKAVSFILANQTPDGGFAEPGRTAGADATTAWSIMALRAAGADPRGAKKDGRSPVDFLAAQAKGWSSVTDYERTLLAAVAAGEDPRSFGGVDLLAKVQSFQGTGGNIGDAVNSNAFGILSYAAAGAAVPAGAVQWHRDAQNGDGGWGNNPGAASNPDMTAASIMALRAAAVSPGDPCITRALAYLRSIQNEDGGFSFAPGDSDVSATSWCVQAIAAAGQDPAGAEWAKGGHTPYGFVASMQAPDGRFLWMRGADKNPVWTTAYAICALLKKPFPVASYSSGTQGGQQDAGDSAGGDQTAPLPGGSGGEETPPAQGEAPAQDSSSQDAEEAKAEPAPQWEGEEGNAEGGKGIAAREVSGSRRRQGSGGASPLVWIIPLAVVAPALAAGGCWWYLRRKRKRTGAAG